jgi:hypothetical protein
MPAMISKITLAAAAAAAVMLFSALPGSAAPAAPLSLLKGAAPSMVEKTHGWHRTCRKGFTDVHRHIKGVGRQTCRSRRCTVDFFGVKTCTWS